MNSNKNQVKWAVTSPFKSIYHKKTSNTLKYTILVLLPLVIGLLIKLSLYLRSRRIKIN